MSKRQRHSWSEAEDNFLLAVVKSKGKDRWTEVAAMMVANGFIRRSPQQYRQRCEILLNMANSQHSWSEEEEILFFQLHRTYGNKWAEISKYFPSKSILSVKNHWYSTIRKQTRKLVKYVSEKVVRTERDWKCAYDVHRKSDKEIHELFCATDNDLAVLRSVTVAIVQNPHICEAIIPQSSSRVNLSTPCFTNSVQSSQGLLVKDNAFPPIDQSQSTTAVAALSHCQHPLHFYLSLSPVPAPTPTTSTTSTTIPAAKPAATATLSNQVQVQVQVQEEEEEDDDDDDDENEDEEEGVEGTNGLSEHKHESEQTHDYGNDDCGNETMHYSHYDTLNSTFLEKSLPVLSNVNLHSTMKMNVVNVSSNREWPGHNRSGNTDDSNSSYCTALSADDKKQKVEMMKKKKKKKDCSVEKDKGERNGDDETPIEMQKKFCLQCLEVYYSSQCHFLPEESIIIIPQQVQQVQQAQQQPANTDDTIISNSTLNVQLIPEENGTQAGSTRTPTDHSYQTTVHSFSHESQHQFSIGNSMFLDSIMNSSSPIHDDDLVLPENPDENEMTSDIMDFFL